MLRIKIFKEKLSLGGNLPKDQYLLPLKIKIHLWMWIWNKQSCKDGTINKMKIQTIRLSKIKIKDMTIINTCQIIKQQS